jgi:putative glutamine amidotransferase
LNLKPVIGITMSYDPKEHSLHIPTVYVDAVLGSGGSPLLLPAIGKYLAADEYLARIDGLLLSGGADIVPDAYGQAPLDDLENPSVLTPDRDAFEIPFTKLALSRGIPILGICRGVQVLNVACGGTLYQDISLMDRAEPISHTYTDPDNLHAVSVLPGSKLAGFMGGERFTVNSSHHQAVKDVPNCLRACAWADDGVIEAVESTDGKFTIGVQWHPERLYNGQKHLPGTADARKFAHAKRLVDAFVAAC